MNPSRLPACMPAVSNGAKQNFNFRCRNFVVKYGAWIFAQEFPIENQQVSRYDSIKHLNFSRWQIRKIKKSRWQMADGFKGGKVGGNDFQAYHIYIRQFGEQDW